MILNNKTFAVATVDRRQTLCAELLEARGASVLRFDSPEKCPRLKDAAAILLPMPLSRDGHHLSAAGGSSDIELSRICDSVAPGTLVLCGMPSDSFCAELLARAVSVFDYASDEAFMLENAYATAEGAVCEAMRMLPSCIGSADVAIIGYGRIAICIHRILVALGCKRITVYARKRSARADAARLGAAVDDLPEGRGAVFVSPHNLVFSTVPHRVIADSELARLDLGAAVIELASAPGGFDLAAAERVGCRAVSLPSLPSRYAPRDAAEYMLRSALRAAEAHNITITNEKE